MTSNSRKNQNRLRIIGGVWRSRVLHFADIPDIRPTPDRVRETLFNWLQFNIAGATCLDLFAGSGVLGFEALSRGASKVVALEHDGKAIAAIRENCKVLETGKLEVIQGSATDWLQHSVPRPFQVVFIDPPFAAGLHERCFELLARGWLAPNALIYVEAASSISDFTLPESWSVQREKRAGGVHYGLCKAAGTQQA